MPANYKMLDRDGEAGVVLDDDGLAVLDAAVAACAAHGSCLILDLHALPGGQNGHWHCDNATHQASLWEHRALRDRAWRCERRLPRSWRARGASAACWNMAHEDLLPDEIS